MFGINNLATAMATPTFGSYLEKIGESESDPEDKMGESQSSSEKMGKIEPRMKGSLVDIISQTWEDIVVKRVTKQMQMK